MAGASDRAGVQEDVGVQGEAAAHGHDDRPRPAGSGDAAAPSEGPATVPDEVLQEVARWRRAQCPGCLQSAMFYCPFCCVPLGVPEGVAVPKVRLPFGRCDIIFDDAPKKATSIHAKVLAPAQVRLVDLFTSDASANRTLSRRGATAGEEPCPVTAVVREIPKYDPQDTVVLFPDSESVLFDDLALAARAALTLVVIEAPWRRAQALRRHPRLAPLRSVRLRLPPASRFWRYHAEGAGCVSSIEALAALAREVAPAPAGGPAAEPWGDPLLFFFARQFALIAARHCKAGLEPPTDEAAKDRRSARVRQKERVKRLRPLGADASSGEEKQQPEEKK
eukprot:CAMPEP_0175680882 /NCGR_PEP_ID=MMETSP0097-20121207/25017_1 /TAXON_ID=311494 /ORGANISM="Alexandrium monilatum, Strain CCMP3105" /LENGTH=334 /DNA_ID=CAMNT_0016987727 /DNA_START=46 /DNA_END=1047 /DNA_ORIENTATION=+